VTTCSRFGFTIWPNMDGLLGTLLRPSAPSSVISRPTCFSSSLRCCWQVSSAPFVRHRCDCLASSAPFTNIQTYLLTYLLTILHRSKYVVNIRYCCSNEDVQQSQGHKSSTYCSIAHTHDDQRCCSYLFNNTNTRRRRRQLTVSCRR